MADGDVSEATGKASPQPENLVGFCPDPLEVVLEQHTGHLAALRLHRRLEAVGVRELTVVDVHEVIVYKFQHDVVDGQPVQVELVHNKKSHFTKRKYPHALCLVEKKLHLIVTKSIIRQ